MALDLLILAPLPPLLAALAIGCGLLFHWIDGEAGERLSSRIALTSAVLALLSVAFAIVLRTWGELPEQRLLGTWFHSGSYRIDWSFDFGTLSLSMAALVAVLSAVTLRFSVSYMHREPGFHRFFALLLLFEGAMLLLALGGNAALSFVGWELAGVCSYLLIAYAYDRPTASHNGTRAFVTNRIGDAGFLLGIFLAFLWVGSLQWNTIGGSAAHLAHWQYELLAACFLLAACAKSAQFPFSPWLARAMEGPTPSSAIFYGGLMIHAGVFLVLRLEPVWQHAPAARAMLAALGLLTAVYGYLCGLTQTDVKSALIFSTSGQVGLMFLEAGLGLWNLALWHLCAHGVFRAYQFLSAPSLMHQILGQPARTPPGFLARRRWLFLAALQRFWLENLGDWLLVNPVKRLARDVQVLELQMLQPAAGLPLTEHEAGPERPPAEVNERLIRVSGLAGHWLASAACHMHWIEERLVLQGVGQGLMKAGRRLGVRLNHFEALLNEPRFLIAFVLATLLSVI